MPRTGPRPNPGPASERGLPLQIETCFHTLPSSLEAVMDRKRPRPRPPACRQGSGGHRCVRTTMPTEASVGPWAPRASLAYLGPVATGKLLPKQTADSSLQGLHAGVPGETGGTEHICHQPPEDSASGCGPSSILALTQPGRADMKPCVTTDLPCRPRPLGQLAPWTMTACFLPKSQTPNP